MSFVDWLRKGFGYVLQSMGVSRPAAKAVPRPESKPAPNSDAEPAPRPGDGSGSQSGGDS